MAPASRTARTWTREEALVELLRGRLSIAGPTTAAALAESFGVAQADIDAALLALEAEGVVLRGVFTPRWLADLEWCDRRLLARIHRYTLNRLRAEIAPVSPAEFMRFLLAWQHVEPGSRLSGADGLRAVLAQLDGVELPARAWERDVLAARLDRCEPAMLDMLCLTGEVAWARLSTGPTQVVGATPIAVFLREHGELWASIAGRLKPAPTTERTDVGAGFSRPATARVLDHLQSRGASFAQEIAAACNLTDDEVRGALGDLVAAGLVSSDGFAGLRAIIGTGPVNGPSRMRGMDSAGRWFAVKSGSDPGAPNARILRVGVGDPGTAPIKLPPEVMRSRPSHGRSCDATGSCSAACSRARPRRCRGAISSASIAGWRHAARSAADGSWPACRGNSSRCPTR